MKREYCHYLQWEDWKHGLYSLVVLKSAEPGLINLAEQLLKNQRELYKAMRFVAFHWPNSAKQNLTNRGRNRRAWLGQAACCFKYGVPESLTKLAWHNLSGFEQDRANEVADEVIRRWEKYHAKNI